MAKDLTTCLVFDDTNFPKTGKIYYNKLFKTPLNRRFTPIRV